MQPFNSSCDESVEMDNMNDGTCEMNLIFNQIFWSKANIFCKISCKDFKEVANFE